MFNLGNEKPATYTHTVMYLGVTSYSYHRDNMGVITSFLSTSLYKHVHNVYSVKVDFRNCFSSHVQLTLSMNAIGSL